MITPSTPILYEEACKNRNSSGGTLVLGERLKGYAREHEHTSVRGEPRGLC